MNKDIILLALDTSITNTGFAIYKNGKYQTSGNIKLENEKELQTWQKADLMTHKLIDRCKLYWPNIIVVEQLDVNNNHKVNSLQSELIGTVKTMAFLTKDCLYYDMSPNEWRALVCRKNDKLPKKRDELKKWDVRRAKEMFKNKLGDIDDNEADAILLAEAYIKKFN